MTTIGFIGAGNIGQAVARLAVDHGYDVVLSNSRGPETLTDVVTGLGDRAVAGTPEEAAARGDLVVVTIPFKAFRDVPVEPLAGKVSSTPTTTTPSATGRSPSSTRARPPRRRCCRSTCPSRTW